MHCSGVGKALLAYSPASSLDKLLNGLEMRRETTHTLTTVADLKRDLARIQGRGFSIDNEESAIGLRCVAAVIFDEHSSALAALSISGPTARVTDARIPALGAAVAGVAAEITSELGGRRPPSPAAR
jgi:IclR family acetate operon transcriptional repressor